MQWITDSLISPHHLALFLLTNGVILYSNSLLAHFSLAFFSEDIVHAHVISSRKSICLYRHACLMAVCPLVDEFVLSLTRCVSIHSLCMHNQTGDSQTSTPLVSWDLLAPMFYLFWPKLIDWGGLRSVQSDLFFFVVVQIWNRSSYVCPRKTKKESIQHWASYVVYTGTDWLLDLFLFQLYVFQI